MNKTPHFFEPRLPRIVLGYAYAAASVIAITLIGAPLLGHLDLANIVMLYPLAVLFSGIRLGRGPAVLAAFLSVLLFDVFFVPPRFTLVVSDVQYLLTFAVLLVVALITAHLATGLKAERDAAQARERQARALYGMARELSAALNVEQIAEICSRFVMVAFKARALLLVPDEMQRLCATSDDAVQFDMGRAAELLQKNGEPPLSTEGEMTYAVLPGPMRLRGVLVLRHGRSHFEDREQCQLLETMTNLLGIALERVHFVDVARKTEIEIESERLRNSLLAALSHDLRTPMAAIAGTAETISLTPPPLSAEQTELLETIRVDALRTNALMNNLLEMGRFQSGGVNLRREWLPIEEVVGSALQAMRSQLHDHELELAIPEDLPLLEIDSVLMERALCNVVENAAKYTPAGSTITIRAQTQSSWLELSVCDDGPGLPNGSSESLFAKFSRGRSESAVAGVGLGLAIVETIVIAHGGWLRAHNQPGGGACFIMGLPLGAPPQMLPETET